MSMLQRIGRPALSLAGWIAGPFLSSGPLFVVYHGVGKGDHDIAISTAEFERHLEHIEASEYEPMTLSSFLDQNRPDDAIVITFDDGTVGQFEAADRLADLGIPAVFFLTPAFVGEDGYVTWNDVKTIPDTHEIGAHTMSHPDLGTVHERDQLRRELVDARDTIESCGDCAVDHFAIPYGKANNLSEEAAAVLRETDYDSICSTTGYRPGRYRHLGPQGGAWLVERTPINDLDAAVFGRLVRSQSLPRDLLREAILQREAGATLAGKLH